MIYDLKMLAEFNDGISEKSEPRELEWLKNAISISIAERFEKLVEAQKPRWVEFEFYTDNEKAMPVMVDANKIILVNQHDKDTPKCYLTFSEGDSGYQTVKGTYAEVMAKLRGEESKERK